MTKVTIIEQEPKEMIPLSEGENGKWYKVANVHLEGEIGIFLSKSQTGSGYNLLVTPEGTCYSHSSIFIEELSEVTVTVKE